MGRKCYLKTRTIENFGQASVNWTLYWRKVIVDSFFTNLQKLGGPGVIVEIDKSKFGKRKYHRGQCVFGGTNEEQEGSLW